jgi:putative transposase
MPWENHTVLEQRFRFIDDWNSGAWNVAELCRFYGVSRQTGYKWIARYAAEGGEGLWDLSRAPHEHPNAVGEVMEDLVIGTRREHGLWGARKIHAWLEREYGCEEVPARSTVGAILSRNGLTVPRKRVRRSRPGSAPLSHADRANRLWCVDFKGWFRTGDGRRMDPLTITDAYSRFLLRCQALKGETYEYCKPVMEATFREYGLPEGMRSDNGAPSGSNGESGLTGLSVWWIKLGIRPERIEPAMPAAANWRQQQKRFEAFREEYNEIRPHEALGQVAPRKYYQPSVRVYPERLPEVSYEPDWEVRRVSPGGQIRWGGESVFVSHALSGELVGLEQEEEEQWRVWFSFYEVGLLDEKSGKVWNLREWRKRHRTSTR